MKKRISLLLAIVLTLLLTACGKEGLDPANPVALTMWHVYKEILDMEGIKESTLKFHNRNIYAKLDISSRKELLMYAALMQKQA